MCLFQTLARYAVVDEVYSQCGVLNAVINATVSGQAQGSFSNMGGAGGRKKESIEKKQRSNDEERAELKREAKLNKAAYDHRRYFEAKAKRGATRRSSSSTSAGLPTVQGHSTPRWSSTVTPAGPVVVCGCMGLTSTWTCPLSCRITFVSGFSLTSTSSCGAKWASPGPGMDPEFVDLFPEATSTTVKQGGCSCTFTMQTFNIMLAVAITGHKFEGATAHDGIVIAATGDNLNNWECTCFSRSISIQYLLLQPHGMGQEDAEKAQHT